MGRWLYILSIIALLGPLASTPTSATFAQLRRTPLVESDLQAFLNTLPGPLKSFQENGRSAAELIQGASAYYGISPRIILALLEATNQLLSDPSPAADALRYPFTSLGPPGFSVQLDWAAAELRAGLGPYDRPPKVYFTDGTILELTLNQASEGVTVQRFLARGRSQADWRAVVEQFGKAFHDYFNNELPATQSPGPPAISGFLKRPWPAGTRVVHLAYFDHMYPTVDAGRGDNGFVVNYRGRGSVQYDGHDGHDFYFPDQPIGTLIYAAADGIAYASTHRGNGVWIEHPGGYVTVYWHLDKFAGTFRGKVNTGQGIAVRAGTLLGTSGRTGFVKGTPHLHFEVRHNGRQVDPYGWYGPEADPCTGYAGCEASTWLWHASLVGEFDFTPPGVTPVDRTPPLATLTVNPLPNLLFLAPFDTMPLQQVGAGTPTIAGMLEYPPARFGQGARIGVNERLAYPVAGNLSPAAGTIIFWADLPAVYPATSIGRHYLLAASAYPDEGPVYTGTLALRREAGGPGGGPRWTFWTTPNNGSSRNELSAPDTLGAGLHHFVITWDRAAGAKALYLDGKLVASASGVRLPDDIGGTLEISRFAPGGVASGVTIDDLAIFDRVLSVSEIAGLASGNILLEAGRSQASIPRVLADVNAIDDAGGIMSVQIGVDGQFSDPTPYVDGYRISLPNKPGLHTIAARFFDRAGNSTVVSSTVLLGVAPK